MSSSVGASVPSARAPRVSCGIQQNNNRLIYKTFILSFFPSLSLSLSLSLPPPSLQTSCIVRAAFSHKRNLTIIRFTHKSCTGFRGATPSIAAMKKLSIRATMFTVSWNCTNFWILVYTDRPHRTTLTIEVKLSSRMTISDASFANSVPAIPIANPISASFSAGASLDPSPVTATTSPC